MGHVANDGEDDKAGDEAGDAACDAHYQRIPVI